MNEPVRVINFREIKKYPVQHVLNTTSRSENWTKGLSPFYVGPIDLYGGYRANNLENAWQFSKVYEAHVDQAGNPADAYFDWAIKGWGDTFAHRYPMGKGAVPLYSYWDGQKLDYIAARKKIYAPLYGKAIVQTHAFRQLWEIYRSGESFVLVDFDGYDYVAEGKTLKEVLHDPAKKMGHAFVLAMLLEYPELRKRCGFIE